MDVAPGPPRGRPASEWPGKLAEMEQWYRDLLARGPDAAEHDLLHDYAPYAEFLGGLRGRVLDLGGGAGLVARYLDDSCDHWVVDPAAVWEEPGWRAFGERFHQRQVHFVRGMGEALPFAEAEFDAGLAMWSLNHAERADLCLAELARVVRPGGPVLVVLEDMEPRVADLAAAVMGRLQGRPIALGVEGGGLKRAAFLKATRRSWPIQQDHYRIIERDLLAWARPALELRSRAWRNGFLSFEFVRRGCAAGAASKLG